MTRPAPEEPAASTGRDDTTSDPSLDDSEGNEWADEGGAVQEGPATDPDDPALRKAVPSAPGAEQRRAAVRPHDQSALTRAPA